MDKLNRPSNIKDRIKEAMADANKKQIDLVRETGLDRGSISRYVSGRYEPKAESISLLGQALGVSEMWLLGYDVPKARTLSKKTNDEIVDLVGWVQEDPELLEVVSVLKHLPKEEYNSFKILILSRQK